MKAKKTVLLKLKVDVFSLFQQMVYIDDSKEINHKFWGIICLVIRSQLDVLKIEPV